MIGNEDWLFRPVLHGLLSGESLVSEDSPVDLAYIVLLNEALDVEQENRYRLSKVK